MIKKIPDAEIRRLRDDARRSKNWKRWGPYLSERQWGTVREDYSPDGSVWGYFTHDQARSRTYRWVKTASWESQTDSVGSVFRSHSGMERTPF